MLTAVMFARAPAASARVRPCPKEAPVALPAADPTPEPDRYLGAAGAAALLQVSPKTVSRWAKEGKLPYLRTLGGHRRYSERRLRELLDDLTQEVAAP
jgi:excisionase family DNA binding protein